jgi:hypothetical protein
MGATMVAMGKRLTHLQSHKAGFQISGGEIHALAYETSPQTAKEILGFPSRGGRRK